MIADRMGQQDRIRDAAYKRSGGQCECARAGHGHFGRCASTITRQSAQFKLKERADREPIPSDLEVLCVFCFRQSAAQGSS